MTCYGCPGGCSRCNGDGDDDEQEHWAGTGRKKKEVNVPKTPTKTGITVITETTCSLCEKKDRRDGAEGTCPPVGWATLDLNIRHEGSGWTNNTKDAWVLCGVCSTALLGWVEARQEKHQK